MNTFLLPFILIALIAPTLSHFTIPLKPQQISNLNKRVLESQTNISLTNGNNMIFTGEIEIGSPPQTFQVIFDTYYSDTVVYSSNCTSCSSSGSSYNASASTTSTDELISTDFTFYSSDKSTQCEIYSDLFYIAGYNLSEAEFLTVETDPILDFVNEYFDGIVGLGFASNSQNLTTPFDRLIIQQNFSKLFSIYYSSTGNQTGSSLIIGGYDSTLAPGGFIYHDISEINTWQLNLDDFGLGNISYSGDATGLQVVITSGYPLIVGDPQIMGDFLQQIPSFGRCSDISSFPNVYFTIDGVKYEIEMSYLYESLQDVCVSKVTDGSSVNISIPQNTIYLGIPFIQSYYTIFDAGNQRIGFAQPAPPKPLASFRFEMISVFFGVLLSVVYITL